VKELEKMSLYVTGTIMANRLPAHLRISKRSREFREMDRGDFKKHLFQYTKEDGNILHSFGTSIFERGTNCLGTFPS
jgi:hypothetical protein